MQIHTSHGTPKGRIEVRSYQFDQFEFIGLFSYIQVYIPDSRALDKMSMTQTIVPWVRQDEQEKQLCPASAFRFPLFEEVLFQFLYAFQML